MAVETKPVKPGKPGRKPNPDKAPRKLGVYRIYTKNKAEALIFVKEYPAKNAQDAVSQHLQGNTPNGSAFIVIPERNITVLSATVENVPKVRITTG